MKNKFTTYTTPQPCLLFQGHGGMITAVSRAHANGRNGGDTAGVELHRQKFSTARTPRKTSQHSSLLSRGLQQPSREEVLRQVIEMCMIEDFFARRILIPEYRNLLRRAC